jgi:hypothetical protein
MINMGNKGDGQLLLNLCQKKNRGTEGNLFYLAGFRFWDNMRVKLDYRPVHMNTLDDEVEPFPPKARVY